MKMKRPNLLCALLLVAMAAVLGGCASEYVPNDSGPDSHGSHSGSGGSCH